MLDLISADGICYGAVVKKADGEFWRWREYMPNAQTIWLTTNSLNFQRHASHRFKNIGNGYFELELPKALFRTANTLN